MNERQVELKLKEMCGNGYIYNNQYYLIKSFKILSKVVRILTDKEDIVVFKEDIEILNTGFNLVPAQVSVVESPANNSYLPERKQLTTGIIGKQSERLAEILMSNIEKVQKDPAFIPQAESINSQIKSVIDLAKTEIEMVKAQAFLNR